MTIEEYINSDDIEIATMYCNIYLQTHTEKELEKVNHQYTIIYNSNKNTVKLEHIFVYYNLTKGVWLKDPSKAVLINS